MSGHHAIVIGSGPNGLAAAIRLAQAGRSVRVLERDKVIGGSLQSAELTLPGFLHDRCSAIHVLAAGSPFLRSLRLGEDGLRYIYSPGAFAHPLDDGTAMVCERSVEATAELLGADAAAYRGLVGPLVRDWGELLPMILSPFQWPAHPLTLARFGVLGVQRAAGFARRHFQRARAQAFFAGAAAHAILPLETPGTTAFGLLMLASGHAAGWPLAEGGSQRLADALAAHLRKLGGEIQTQAEVRTLEGLAAEMILADVSPRQLMAIAGDELPAGYLKKLRRFRQGAGVFKVDWALSAPIPWRAEGCHRAATVHIGGTLEEIAAAEAACWNGGHAERPFVLLTQPTVFDGSRAPAGRHIAWAYCHVPNGSTRDMTDAIERQIERFAPGFREVVLARHTMNTQAMESHNPNLTGGDISGGAQTLGQTLFRPRLLPSPYSTPRKGLYLCSASTPPGPGTHGMCGFNAAHAALARARSK